MMKYQIRDFGDVTTTRCFDTLDEVYAYVAGAIDVTDYTATANTVGPWALWRLDGDGEQEVLPAGELLARAEVWRQDAGRPRVTRNATTAGTPP